MRSNWVTAPLKAILMGATALAGATALGVGPAEAQTPPPQKAQAAPVQTVTEVIVTATKRGVRLQDTPEAISVVTSNLIQNLNINSFQDYASLIPNLNQAGGAGLGTGTIVMRGLNTGPQSLTSTTSVYLGETPFSSNGSFAVGSLQTPDPDLVDVDHIEVLKGPQGTLYGASSLGGLIRIIPKEPDVNADGIHGNLRVGGDVAEGGDTGGGVRGSVYLPVVPGKLAIGVAGFQREDPGFITNVTTGHDYMGRARSEGGTVSAVLQAGRFPHHPRPDPQ